MKHPKGEKDLGLFMVNVFFPLILVEALAETFLHGIAESVASVVGLVVLIIAAVRIMVEPWQK